MPTKSRKSNLRAFNSASLSDAFEDFFLSRQGMNSSPNTLAFYTYTARAFLLWTEGEGVTKPKTFQQRSSENIFPIYMKKEGKIQPCTIMPEQSRLWLGFCILRDTLRMLSSSKCRKLKRSVCQFCVPDIYGGHQ